jgi:tetratricopeptide (TPR) repeat protein
MKKSILFALLVNTSVMADQASVDAIESASMTLNQTELSSLAEQTSGFDKALANYRLALAQNLNGDADSASKALDSAIEQLESLTEQNLDDAESWILLAQTYGYKVNLSPMKSVIYGPKSTQALATALDLAPNNPRVHLVKGVQDFNTPAIFGGSKKAAIKSFNKAIELFQQDSAVDTQWGNAEVYVWRGIAKLDLNDSKAAIADWQTALDLAPNYSWPQYLIAQNK